MAWINVSVVPGHEEIVGRVVEVGAGVGAYKVGDLVGVGCLVDSCTACSSCQQDLNNFEEGAKHLPNSPDKHIEGKRDLWRIFYFQ
jgi:uncharacterized zinc-type alcohol dehydrogenase-like protein